MALLWTPRLLCPHSSSAGGSWPAEGRRQTGWGQGWVTLLCSPPACGWEPVGLVLLRWEHRAGRAGPRGLSEWARGGRCPPWGGPVENCRLSPQPPWGQEEQPPASYRHQEPVQPAQETGPAREERPCPEEDPPQGPDASHPAPAVRPASWPRSPPYQGRYEDGGAREGGSGKPELAPRWPSCIPVDGRSGKWMTGCHPAILKEEAGSPGLASVCWPGSVGSVLCESLVVSGRREGSLVGCGRL